MERTNLSGRRYNNSPEKRNVIALRVDFAGLFNFNQN